MDYRTLMVISWVSVGVIGLAAIGCGDDGPGDEAGLSGPAGTTTTNDSDSTTEASGDTINPPPPPPPTTDGNDTEASTSTMTSSADTTDGQTGDSTAADTDSAACADLGMRACMASEQCMTIGGAEIQMTNNGACLGEREFLDCQPLTGCGDAITYACEGPDAPMYQFIDTCIPDGWVECGPPPPVDLLPCE